MLTKEIESLHDQSEKEFLNSPRKSTSENKKRSSLIVQNLTMSKTSSNKSTNESITEQHKYKSCFSIKDNAELINKIDQIISLILRLYDEVKYEDEKEKYSDKITLISQLLNSVKLLSLNKDNHQIILELVITYNYLGYFKIY